MPKWAYITLSNYPFISVSVVSGITSDNFTAALFRPPIVGLPYSWPTVRLRGNPGDVIVVAQFQKNTERTDSSLYYAVLSKRSVFRTMGLQCWCNNWDGVSQKVENNT